VIIPTEIDETDLEKILALPTVNRALSLPIQLNKPLPTIIPGIRCRCRVVHFNGSTGPLPPFFVWRANEGDEVEICIEISRDRRLARGREIFVDVSEKGGCFEDVSAFERVFV
jgi:hypothetical protein